MPGRRVLEELKVKWHKELEVYGMCSSKSIARDASIAKVIRAWWLEF